MAIAAVYWGLGTLPTWRWLLARPGPPIPPGASLIATSAAGTARTFRDAFRLPQTAWYLLWWMIGS